MLEVMLRTEATQKMSHFRWLTYNVPMTTLVATSVIRGSRQGDSHGGVYLIDLERQRIKQAVDWNTTAIDWQGRGWDRGLRGIAFDDERVFVAASDELFVYDPEFESIASYRSPYLKHCHEIYRYERRLFLTSTGFDSVLAFDLDENRFSMGLHIAKRDEHLAAVLYDPNDKRGPAAGNEFHLNSVYCDSRGMFISGLRTGALLVFGGRHIEKVAAVPQGTHNARPFRDGIVFNDSEADVVRFVAPGKQRIFKIPRYPDKQLTHTDLDDSRIARQAFGRGLCAINDHVIATGSSPSTITLHDLESMKSMVSINLTMDIRNAIHGLEVWPFSV
jgi:hypothetical protein